MVYYHHTDHLGTTEVITDSNGNIVWHADYEAFGSVMNERGEENFTPNYTGKFFDESSGLYYFNARWYDSELGRFTTQDPARDGVNWWIYCDGNPITFVDPDGMFYYEGIEQKRSLYLEAKSTTVVILRKDDGTGNSFNSERYVYKDYGFGKHIVFHDMVGANCKKENVSDENFTEPDGEYYYSVDKLTKQDDGTYDSGSYENTLQVKTNDPNMPEDVRNKINNAKQPFLDHANQQSKKNKGIYGNNERVESAGCVIGKDGQDQQDKYMEALFDGVKEISSIKRIIHSYSNGTID